MLSDILYSVVLLYAVLAIATYYDYKWPVNFFGNYLPRSYSLWSWLLLGPFVMFGIGIMFGLAGIILLLPIVFFALGLNWIALLTLFIYAYVARDSSLLSINGLIVKFDFPFDIPVGLAVWWIMGILYIAVGALLLSPIVLFAINTHL